MPNPKIQFTAEAAEIAEKDKKSRASPRTLRAPRWDKKKKPRTSYVRGFRRFPIYIRSLP